MNPTSPYWNQEQIFTKEIKHQPLQESRLGFQFDIPHPDPTTAGIYYGENPVAGRAELTFGTPKSEYFAVQNIIPSVGGIPRYNPYDRTFHYQRSQVTHKFEGS